MTKEILNELFQYREGQIFWKIKPAKQIAIGARAGTTMSHKYRQVQLRYGLILEHRIIWIMHFGEIPEGFTIDHIDHNPSNNSIGNLRIATFAENTWNSKKSKNNTSGFKGVYFSKDKNKWTSQIGANGVTKHLGYFDTAESAHEVYKQAANKLHKEFANY